MAGRQAGNAFVPDAVVFLPPFVAVGLFFFVFFFCFLPTPALARQQVPKWAAAADRQTRDFRLDSVACLALGVVLSLQES